MVTDSMIPEPAEVRLKLAENLKEGQLLKSLYRLSIKAARERQDIEAQRSRAASPRATEAVTC